MYPGEVILILAGRFELRQPNPCLLAARDWSTSLD
jgi:hypothetical protein